MTTRETILKELNDLESTLENLSPQNLYAVPTGYFEGLPTRIMNRIKALEATNARDELEYLSPLLSNLSKRMPYSVPAGFFQNFADGIMRKLSENGNEPEMGLSQQTSEEEIRLMSPLLSTLKNKNPYSVPAGYFENLETNIEKKETRVIFIKRQTWYRYAAAAIFIGVIAIGAVLFIGPRQPDINKNPQAWINKNLSKKVSEDKIDELVNLAEGETATSAKENDAAKQAEIKELMKDISEKEIEEFLNDAIAMESNDTGALMN